jgi:hypothetical protein
MEKKNDYLLESFSENFNILSATINKFEIYLSKGLLVIDFYMKLLYPQDMKIKMSFYGIKEYSFYWNENHIFYNIESYKFFKTGNLFYISLDPDGEEDIRSQNDQDFILCEKIYATPLGVASLATSR